jgi:hypothetical protein
MVGKEFPHYPPASDATLTLFQERKVLRMIKWGGPAAKVSVVAGDVIIEGLSALYANQR